MMFGHSVAEEIDQHRERSGQCDPDHRPRDGLTKRYDMLFTMEDAQVERQHCQHEDVKENPENPIGGHRKESEFSILTGGKESPVTDDCFRIWTPRSHRPTRDRELAIQWTRRFSSELYSAPQ